MCSKNKDLKGRHRCGECNREMEEYWDYSGYGYSTKLARCPECGKIKVLKVVEDYWMRMLGNDGMDYRYYNYNKKNWIKGN